MVIMNQEESGQTVIVKYTATQIRNVFLWIPEQKNVDCILWFRWMKRDSASVTVQQRMNFLMHGTVRYFIKHLKKCVTVETEQRQLRSMQYPAMVYGKRFRLHAANAKPEKKKEEYFMMIVKWW